MRSCCSAEISCVAVAPLNGTWWAYWGDARGRVRRARLPPRAAPALAPALVPETLVYTAAKPAILHFNMFLFFYFLI